MFSLGRIWLVLLLYILLSSFPALGAVSTKPDKTRVLSAASSLHLPFVANRGQVKDPAVAFTADTFACRVEVTRDGRIVYVRSQTSKGGGAQMKISERIMGARIAVEGKDRQTTRISYFPGRDQSQWQSGVPGYGRVTLGHITPRIRVDLKAHGNNVEKLFHLAPGADPARIWLAVQGADEMRVSPDGDLVLTTSTGNMRLTRPVAYQEIGGERRMVAVRYTTRGNTYGFIVGAHDPSRDLVIDPLLKVFTVFEGDDIYNAFLAVTGDAAGNIYAAGYIHNQLVIYKFDHDLEKVLGTVVFSIRAYYQNDVIRSIALDSQGNVFVAGRTSNEDFPVTPGCHDDQFDVLDDDYDGFIAKFSPDLVHLLAATYIGGDWYDYLYDLAIDPEDRIFVAGCSMRGETDKHLFPVSDTAYDPNSGPVYWKKAVVARLSNDLTTVEAATYLGAQNTDTSDQWPAKTEIAYCLSLTNTGEVWVVGCTDYNGFPTTPDSLDATHNGEKDLFLAKLDADLSQLRYSTYIGGEKDEAPTDLILNSAGELFLTGWTFSADFPVTSDGYDTSYGFHEEDGFILKLAPDGNEILAGTYLGGQNDGSPNGDDIPSGLALSPDETQLAVVGRTESLTFPTTPGAVSRLLDAAIAKKNGVTPWFTYNDFAIRDEGIEDPDTGDGFLSILSSDLSALRYSSFIGSKRCDYFDAVFANGKDIIIVGETQANNFPLAPQTPNNNNRALVLRFGEEDPDGPNDGDTPNSNKGSSGGGGACFIHTILP
jgi:hypothetical protein